jgi:hypothetical protein
LVAVAALTAGAYELMPTAKAVAAAASLAAPEAKAATASLDRIVRQFPAQLTSSRMGPPDWETPCSDSADRVPLVLYSSVEGLRTGTPAPAAETSLFVGHVPVTNGAINVPAKGRVAMLRTTKIQEPGASAGTVTPGLYEGALVIFDASSNEELCHAHVNAQTSATAEREGSAAALHDDFASRVRTAISVSASRLHIELEM